jgi:hypothetical protein
MEVEFVGKQGCNGEEREEKKVEGEGEGEGEGGGGGNGSKVGTVFSTIGGVILIIIIGSSSSLLLLLLLLFCSNSFSFLYSLSARLYILQSQRHSTDSPLLQVLLQLLLWWFRIH